MAFMATAVVPRPPLLAAADPPWHPAPCPPETGGATGAGTPARATAWYRLDGVLDARGSLAGQRLIVGEVGGRSRRIELPPESFASGPADGRIVVGADDGTRSAVSVVDVGRGCATPVGDEADVVRSALLEPGGDGVWEHRVDRATRADRGIWRVAAGGGERQALPGVALAGPYGRTYTTELRWAADGRLAVTSCGELRCRTRLLDTSSGQVDEVGPTGAVVGVLDDGVVVAHDACPGFPCGLIARSPGGDVRTLAREAGRAAVAGGRVVFEDGVGLAVIDVARAGVARVRDAAGLVPLADGSLARAGVAHDRRLAVLTPPAGFDPAALRVLAAGAAMPAVLPEVAP